MSSIFPGLTGQAFNMSQVTVALLQNLFNYVDCIRGPINVVNIIRLFNPNLRVLHLKLKNFKVTKIPDYLGFLIARLNACFFC